MASNVGILRPDGETGADVLAVTVRTDYMPGEDWRTLCQRGRTLREDAGTLTGDALGHHDEASMGTPAIDAPDVVRALGGSTAPTDEPGPVDVGPVELPEPLAGVIAYLDTLAVDDEEREFVPTAELVEALALEDAQSFARSLAELGVRPTRGRVPDDDGGMRRVRGYLVAALREAAERVRTGGQEPPDDGDGEAG